MKKNPKKTSLTLKASSETYLEPCQTSTIAAFAKIENGFSLLAIFAKSSILELWQDFELASEAAVTTCRKSSISVV